jgi:hypothetical protein
MLPSNVRSVGMPLKTSCGAMGRVRGQQLRVHVKMAPCADQHGVDAAHLGLLGWAVASTSTMIAFSGST